MSDAEADGRFDLLLCRMFPLAFAPAGAPQVRGVVRAGAGHARIVVSPETATASAIAVDYELSPAASRSLDVTGAVDHAQFTVAPAAARLSAANRHGPRDSHGNIVLAAVDTGFDYSAQADAGDQPVFGLFDPLTGGGLPWFADDYTFAGFLYIDADTCRIYLRVTGTDRTYGIDLAVGGPAGYSHLASALAPLAQTGDLVRRPVVDDTDDYCDAVVDPRARTGPAGPVPPH
ncbi:hypothetical protein AB0L57_11425 [Nocardia sp. NPDC052254]|uniref:hypothetical protein n=1 Tax=Nocardia sp. NPDC052254 TaxID=3155681 RepID=UPI003431882A